MKTLIWTGILVGGVAGGYVPTLFGSSLFSMASFVGNFAGGRVGLAIGYKAAIALGLD